MTICFVHKMVENSIIIVSRMQYANITTEGEFKRPQYISLGIRSHICQ